MTRYILILSLLFVAVFARAEQPELSVADLVEQLKSEDRDLRREAAYQLDRLGAKSAEAAPILSEALKDSDQQIWWWSASALAKIGPDAKVAIPILMSGLGSRGHTVYLGRVGVRRCQRSGGRSASPWLDGWAG